MSGPLKVEVFGRTDVGKTRDHNEDSFMVADLSRQVASLQLRNLPPRATLAAAAEACL